MKPVKTNRLVVVVPVFQSIFTDDEKLSIRSTIKHMYKYDVVIVCPKHVVESSLLKEFNFDFRYLVLDDEHFVSIQSYNHLLLSAWFYEMFDNYEYMLIAQTDALILNSNIEVWVDKGYSFVGAPWVNDIEIRKHEGLFKSGVLNGGLSLRKISHHIKVLKSNKKIYPISTHLKIIPRNKGIWRQIKFVLEYFHAVSRFSNVKNNVLVNEDRILSYAWKQFDFFKIPTPDIALQFAFENHPDLLFELNGKKLPFGCHAWNKYNKNFYTNLFYNLK